MSSYRNHRPSQPSPQPNPVKALALSGIVFLCSCSSIPQKSLTKAPPSQRRRAPKTTTVSPAKPTLIISEDDERLKKQQAERDKVREQLRQELLAEIAEGQK